MPLVVKINPEWKPSENPNLEVGGIVDITDAGKLIADGTVKLYVKKEVKKIEAVKKEITKKGGKK